MVPHIGACVRVWQKEFLILHLYPWWRLFDSASSFYQKLTCVSISDCKHTKMGNSHSECGIKHKEVEKLKELTDFSGSEIREWHQRFHEEYPSGFISQEEFVSMYKEMFPSGDATYFGESVFKVKFILTERYRVTAHNSIGKSLRSKYIKPIFAFPHDFLMLWWWR